MATEEILSIDKNEQVLLDIRRHPIGLIGIWAGGIVGALTLLGLLFFAVRNSDTISLGLGASEYGILFGMLIVFLLGLTAVGAKVYKDNQLVITNENIIQVLQFSFLNRQVSQLNLAKIQDVSVDQKGFIQTFFGYGTIEIETAGEASNFRFPFVTNPNRVSKIIIEAHEDYTRRHAGGHNTYRI